MRPAPAHDRVGGDAGRSQVVDLYEQADLALPRLRPQAVVLEPLELKPHQRDGLPDEDQQHQQGDDRGDPVTPDRDRRQVPPGRGPRDDRLAAEVALDILREVPGAGVPRDRSFSSALSAIVSTSPRSVRSIVLGRAGASSRMTRVASWSARPPQVVGQASQSSSYSTTPSA